MPAAEARKVASDFPLPSKAQRGGRPASTRRPTTPRRCGSTCSPAATSSADAGRALEPAVPRRPADPHHVRPVAAGTGRAGQGRQVAGRTRRASTPPIVSLDTKTGAIRAMVGGDPFQRAVNEVNMALSTRQTGSSIKIFILAAALQAGAQPSDMIDGTAPCTLPNPGDPKDPFTITDAVERRRRPARIADVALDQLRLRPPVARSSGSTALSTPPTAWVSRASSSRTPASPPGPTRSPLDMASGMQTIANQGLHHDPYYVE